MQVFDYSQTEIDALCEQDPVLGKHIRTLGTPIRQLNCNPFSELIRSIISQQISVKAAKTVTSRVIAHIGSLSPQTIDSAETETLRGCGLSARKVGYMKHIASSALYGTIDFDNLHTQSNEEIIETLVSLPGVGVWTAEMLLLHALARRNVISYGDFAIRKAMEHVYQIEKISKQQFRSITQQYAPYESIASIYLWEISTSL
ncbi:MAG: DNA-3-methyladenine glycosylase family protein [Bacilli bacterium]